MDSQPRHFSRVALGLHTCLSPCTRARATVLKVTHSWVCISAVSGSGTFLGRSQARTWYHDPFTSSRGYGGVLFIVCYLKCILFYLATDVGLYNSVDGPQISRTVGPSPWIRVVRFHAGILNFSFKGAGYNLQPIKNLAAFQQFLSIVYVWLP